MAPARALRPCLGMPGRPCRELVRDANRCRSCAALRERARGTTAARGLGGAYQKLAARVIREEKGCRLCGSTDVRARRPDDVWTAHHLVPRALGGRLTRENLGKAHRSCNSAAGPTPTGR